jgi:hypothetical protein
MSETTSDSANKAQGQICPVCGAMYYGTVCPGCNPSLPFGHVDTDAQPKNDAIGTPSQLKLIAS